MSYYICTKTMNLVSSESVRFIQCVNVTVVVLRVNKVDLVGYTGGCIVVSRFLQ